MIRRMEFFFRRAIRIPVMLVFLTLLTACARGSIQPPTATLPPGSGETAPARTSTAPEAATDTAPAQLSSAPTATAPAATGLNPAGPYVLFEGDGGIWIANPDGGFLTRIYDHGLRNPAQDIHRSLSPKGDRLALVTAGAKGPNLVELDLPSGKATPIAHLEDITQNEIALNSFTPKAFADYAITDFPDVAWQPGSNEVLAFLSAIPGPSADLFVYDFAAGKSRQLEKDPTQAIDPIWSPNGKYLLQAGISWVPPYGATYVGFHPMDGVWAVRMSDGAVIPQPAPKGDFHSLLGWWDDSHYLIYDSDKKCLANNLRSVDVTTGQATPLLDYCLFTQPAWSPINHAVIFSIDSGCGCSSEPGTYLILPGSPAPRKLSDKSADSLAWLPESGLFQAYPEALYSADGNTRYDPPAAGSSFNPAVSPAGFQAWEVIENHVHRVKVKFPDGAWHPILEGNVGTMIWDAADGNTLLIALEDGTLFAASAPDFNPKIVGNLGGIYDQAVWVV